MFSKFTDDKEGREIVETTPRSEVWGGGGGGVCSSIVALK
jgi:hypothetical protein